MTFARSEVLVLLWALPFWAAFMIWALHRRERAIEAFVQAGVLDIVRPQSMLRGRRWQAFWWTVAWVSFVVALSQPRLGFVWRELEQRGIDLVVALDVSASMDATDISPSRMERSRREVLDLLTLIPADRVGLVVFAGGAYPRLPLTLDHDALRMVLKETSTSTIRAQGSAFDRAIDESVAMLSDGGESQGAVLLITDGEAANADAAVAAAERAAEAGIPVYGLLVGTEAGAPIPLASGGFKKTRTGEVVVSRARADVLQQVAKKTGGALAKSVPGDGDVHALIRDEIHAAATASTQRVRRERVWNERFQIPLLLGIVALALSSLSVGRPRRMRGQLGLAAVALLTVSTARAQSSETSVAPSDEASVEPTDPYTAMELGASLYRAGKFHEAERVWEMVAERSNDPKLQAIARYNMGNAAYQGGRLVDAIADYGQALQLDPNLTAAEANGQAVAQELQQRMQPPEEQQSDQSEDGENQEQSEQEPGEDSQQDSSESGKQSDAQDQASGEREQAPEQAQERIDPDQLEQAGAADTGPAENTSGEETAFAAGEHQANQLSEEQARRLLDAVEEGVPHVVVGGEDDGEQDW